MSLFEKKAKTAKAKNKNFYKAQDTVKKYLYLFNITHFLEKLGLPCITKGQTITHKILLIRIFFNFLVQLIIKAFYKTKKLDGYHFLQCTIKLINK